MEIIGPSLSNKFLSTWQMSHRPKLIGTPAFTTMQKLQQMEQKSLVVTTEICIKTPLHYPFVDDNKKYSQWS